MRYIISLLIALALPLSAQTANVDGRPVALDTTITAQRTIYNSLLALNEAQVQAVSLTIVQDLDSTFAAVLTASGISMQADRRDSQYLRVRVPPDVMFGSPVPMVHSTVVRAQWVADGAIQAEGDTLRMNKSKAAAGLARLAQFYP